MSRAGARALLAGDSKIVVVGEASDALEAVAVVTSHQPNVALLDLNMPGLEGEEMIRRIAEAVPDTSILVFSMRTDEEAVAGCFLAGADGYALKSDPPSELRQALAAVAEGRLYLSPAFSKAAIRAAKRRILTNEGDPVRLLSPREREVFQLIGDGKTAKEVGERLGISPRTVENHRARVMLKLGLENQRELLKFALRRSLREM